MELSLAGIRAMVVDDDPSILSPMATLLKHWGCDSVKVALDGRSALGRASEPVPELVLMDVEIPKMNGYEAARLLKERLPTVYIIMVTGVPDGRLARKALDEGVARAVVPRPFRFDQLKMAMESFLKEGKGLREKREAEIVA